MADPHTEEDPLSNLTTIRNRMDSLHRFISHTLTSNTILPPSQLDLVNSELTSAIHSCILNASTLLSLSYPFPKLEPPTPSPDLILQPYDPTSTDPEIVEIDAVELLAEQIHVCEVCGKGFKRDANLRMHMRAHGDQYKTQEALSRPDRPKHDYTSGRNNPTRFSCPYVGCNRNRRHKSFKPLKSVVCVKNHFKRSHCPKMYGCEKCKRKSFSVVADLRSHMKSCGGNNNSVGSGSSVWRCSCGTTFSRKDKLFGHVALFEGHSPAITGSVGEERERSADGDNGGGFGFLINDEDEDDQCLKDMNLMMGSYDDRCGDHSSNDANLLMDEFFNF